MEQKGLAAARIASGRCLFGFYNVGIFLALLILFGLSSNSPAQQVKSARPVTSEASRQALRRVARFEPIVPIPLNIALDTKKVALGEKLFHEPRLSQDNSVSCASCHNLQTGGTDRKQFSTGIHGAIGSLNAPTVFNTSLHFKLFWDGRANTLEDQIEGPLLSSIEMGTNWSAVIRQLTAEPMYYTAFCQIYPEGVTRQTVKDALATFERSLMTPNSRFDQFLRGDNSVLNAAEQDGYRLFKTYGCVSCHQGVAVGGNMFEPFGVMADYFLNRGDMTPADLGRFNVTGEEEDRHIFKVPSLRNVALTPPYFHDGSATTLHEAVRIMALYQLGRRLPGHDINRIVAFLKTLSGEYRAKPLAAAGPVGVH